MIFKEFLDLVDSQRIGIAWIMISDEDGALEAKVNTRSAFAEYFHDRELIDIKADRQNVFCVRFKGEENQNAKCQDTEDSGAESSGNE